MSSLWNRSGTIERYGDDLRADGAEAFFFEGGTTTPLVVYRDSGEAAAFPWPVKADANGRWPDVFVPYIVGYDVQVKTKFGVQLSYSEQIPNPDPVELTVTIDPLEKVQTGMIHAELVNSTKAGYVRLNGKTIGNAASSTANSERNNNDTQALFTYLWNNLQDAIAPVTPGGRGASAAADFAANKTIVLPSFQGAMPIGLDDMGATPANAFDTLVFSVGGPLIPGSKTGTNTFTLAIANLPAHSHSGTTATEGAHTHSGTTEATGLSVVGNTGAGTAHTHADDLAVVSAGAHTHFTIDDTVGDAVINDPTDVLSIAINYGTDQSYTLAAKAGGTQIWGPTSSNGDHTHTLSGSIQNESAHTHPININLGTHTHGFTTGAGTAHSHTFTTSSQGSSTPFNNLGRVVTVTWFIKL